MKAIHGFDQREMLIRFALTGSEGDVDLKTEDDARLKGKWASTLWVLLKEGIISKIEGLIYIFLMVISLGIFNYICLSLSGDFDVKQYFLLSITPLFSSIVIYFICMYLSTFTHKTKKMLGISLGIVFVSYVLQIFSTMATEVEFLKYFSVFTLADIRNVIIDISINPMMILISFGISILFFGLTIFQYNKKELI